MKKKLAQCLSLAMAIILAVGTSAYAGESQDGPENAPSSSIATTDDGLLIDGEAVTDEGDYLHTEKEAGTGCARTFDSSASGLLDSITDSEGKYEGYDVYTAADAAEYCIGLMRDHVESTDGKFLVAVEYDTADLDGASPYAYAFDAYTAAFADAFTASLSDGGGGGDYLLYSMYGKPFAVTSSCKYFTSGSRGIALVWATPSKATYYTTAAEEKDFKDKAASVVKSLSASAGDSDYDKVCAVFDYICDNVEYDYDHLGESDYYTMYTAYGALCRGQAVCQGYANLFYYLCGELGVPCRIVAGTGYTGSASGPHAWNIVQLDGTWYHVDSTWGASYSKWYSGRYFFLQSEQNFVNGHNATSHVMDYMTGIQYIDYTSSEFLSAYPISQVNDYCSHSYSMVSSKKASCGTYGYEVYRCGKCGETYEDTLQALEHSWSVTAVPSCEKEGQRTCANCGAAETVPATGHSYEAAGTAEAGCVTDGYTVYICSECGHEHRGDVTESLGGHDYALDEERSYEMTHTSAGEDVYVCSVCGAEDIEIYPAVTHHTYDSFSAIGEDEEKTALCGYDYEAVCTICGRTETVPSLLHVFELYEDDELSGGQEELSGCSRCVHCGLIVDADGNVMRGDGEELLYDESASVHESHDCEENADIIGAVEASCLTPGHAGLTQCSVCGKILSDTDDGTFTEPSGHSPISAGTAATCTEDGHESELACGVCGEIISHGSVIPATGHSLVTEKGKDATCTADGMTDYAYCGLCGYVEEEGEILPAQGHSLVTSPATCRDPAYIYCENCGYTEYTGEPATGHRWNVIDSGYAATCYTAGQEAYIVCEYCGEVDSDGSATAAGHSLTHIEYSEPTEYEDGSIECWYCHDCGTFFLNADATQEITFEDTVLTYGHEIAAQESDGPEVGTQDDGDVSGGEEQDAENEDEQTDGAASSGSTPSGGDSSGSGAESGTGDTGSGSKAGSGDASADSGTAERTSGVPESGSDRQGGSPETVQTGETPQAAPWAGLLCSAAALGLIASGLSGKRRKTH